MEMNAVAAFRITRILKELSDIVSDKILCEKKILDKWIDKDADGNIIKPKNEDGATVDGAISVRDINGFTKEMKELMDIENELSYEKLNFEDLGIPTAKVSDIMKLEFLFI
jgi:predicted transposase YbfD/YdcC